MTGMKFLGPAQRAKEVRAATNRLRWEMDWALGDESPAPRWELGRALNEIGEALALLRQTLITMDERLPAEEAAYERKLLANALAFYADHHRSAR